MSREPGAVQPDFIGALQELARGENWWSETLRDPGLTIAVRDNYLNVYWLGQSLFKIEYTGTGAVRAETHSKYLLDPDLATLAAFDGQRFNVPPYERMLIHRYVPKRTLAALKRAAGRFAPREKKGVHTVVRNNPNAVDVEVALAREAPALGERHVPQIDVAALEADGGLVRLVFWEAKLFCNADLRAAGGRVPAVLEQIGGYRKALRERRAGVLESYRQVAKDLVAIAGMSGGVRVPDQLTVRVAEDPGKLTMAEEPDVGLLIYGFDADQRDGRFWRPHRDKLLGALPNRVRAGGARKRSDSPARDPCDRGSQRRPCACMRPFLSSTDAQEAQTVPATARCLQKGPEWGAAWAGSRCASRFCSLIAWGSSLGPRSVTPRPLMTKRLAIAAARSGATAQYSWASMMVSTRRVTIGSAASEERPREGSY